MIRLSGLRTDRSGNTTTMLAGGLSALLATATLGIDAGAVFLEKRRLQGIADAAALAAAGDPAQARARAEAVIAASHDEPASLAAIETGDYTADPAIVPASRFRAGTGSAARVTVSGRAPSYFGRALGFGATAITARATAAQIDLAAFSIGTRLATVNGGAANSFLSGLAGTELQLATLDYQALAGARVDLFRFADALRTELALDGATFSDVLAADVTLPQVLRAASKAADGANVQAILLALAGRVPATPLSLAGLIDLGPAGRGIRADLATPVAVDALAMLRAALELAGGARQVAADLDFGLPGIAAVRLRSAVGARTASSPWLALGRAGQATVRTAQARLYLDVQLAGAAPLGLGPVRLPLFVELAQAEARLSAITCAGGPSHTAVTLAATPSAGRIAIADMDTGGFHDFARAPTLRPAQLVRVPLVAVTGQSETRLGARSRAVEFDAAAITAHQARTITTDDLVTSVTRDLIGRLSLSVSVAGLGLGTGAITAALAPVLSAAAPALDALLAQAGALTGVGIGQADLWIDGVRCGTPMLVG